MPPPPPSKSYLLKFDDLSDSDDDNSYVPRKTNGSSYNELPQLTRSRSTFSVQSSLDDDNEASSSESLNNNKIHEFAEGKVGNASAAQKTLDPIVTLVTEDETNRIEKIHSAGHEKAINHLVSDDDDDDEDDIIDEQELDDDDDESRHPDDGTKKKRKKKKSKKKKKKKGKNQASTNTQSTTSVDTVNRIKAAKSVSFGSVAVLEFERSLGYDVVPYDGGWPLGMSMEVVSNLGWEVTSSGKSSKSKQKQGAKPSLTVDTISLDEYEEQRQLKLIERWNVLKANNADDVTDLKVPLETRQWDYRRKCKNPLFRMSIEKERMEILITHSTPDDEDNSNGGSSPTSPAPPGRSRSGSFSDTILASAVASSSSSSSRGKGRTRSFSSNDKQQGSTGGETYNAKYTQVEIHAVRNEIERIRNDRSTEGSLGCTCRKLNVYLLPADGGGGKKANHRRMKVEKVKAELRKRHLLPTETKTREELELLLYEAVENEPCCSFDDCPCYHNGIDCQADTCSCWFSTHQTTELQKKMKAQSDAVVPLLEIQRRCGNKYGMYTVDTAAIDDFRKKYIYCQIATA